MLEVTMEIGRHRRGYDAEWDVTIEGHLDIEDEDAARAYVVIDRAYWLDAGGYVIEETLSAGEEESAIDLLWAQFQARRN